YGPNWMPAPKPGTKRSIFPGSAWIGSRPIWYPWAKCIHTKSNPYSAKSMGPLLRPRRSMPTWSAWAGSRHPAVAYWRCNYIPWRANPPRRLALRFMEHFCATYGTGSNPKPAFRPGFTEPRPDASDLSPSPIDQSGSGLRHPLDPFPESLLMGRPGHSYVLGDGDVGRQLYRHISRDYPGLPKRNQMGFDVGEYGLGHRLRRTSGIFPFPYRTRLGHSPVSRVQTRVSTVSSALSMKAGSMPPFSRLGSGRNSPKRNPAIYAKF